MNPLFFFYRDLVLFLYRNNSLIMAKYLDQAGITVLVGQITNAYDERYAAISHTRTTANVISLGGYSATSVSGTTLTDTDSLNAALKKLYNLSSSKLSTIPISTRTVLGGIKVGKHYTAAATFSPVSTDPETAPKINSVSTNADRYYVVETDSNGLAFVNVPWTDLNTTYTFTPANPTLAWGAQSSIGVIGDKTYNVTMPNMPSAAEVGALPADGTAVSASKVTNSLILKIKSGSTEGTDQYTFNGSAAKTLDIKAGSNVSLTAAAGVLTIAATNTTYSVANQTTLGLIKPWMVHTAASTYNGGSAAPASDATAVNVNTLSTTTGRYYAVEMDNAGRAFVNVPWTDTQSGGTVTSVAMTVPTGLSIAGSPITKSGTLALTFTDGYSIPKTADQTNWNAAFGWGNHASAGYLKSIPQASDSVLGGIKIGYTTSDKNYAVQLDAETGAAFVNVPWTDTKNPGTVTSITLTQGAGITVSDSGTAITTSGTRTISLNTATNTAKGGFMPWMSHTTASTYNGGSSAPAANATVVNVNAISTTTGKYYAVETDSNGRAFVNVPWTDSNTNYYPTAFAWTPGTTAGPTGSLTGSGMSPVSFGAIPSASASASGVVTTGAQTFAGTKTLTATLQAGSTATTQSAGDDSTKVATTAFVHDAIANDITALSESEIQSAVEAALAAL